MWCLWHSICLLSDLGLSDEGEFEAQNRLFSGYASPPLQCWGHQVETQGGHSLLIADDDPACRSVLKEIFEPRGFRTFLASTGEEALALVEVHPVDCMLLDFNMPGMSGLDLVRVVRQFHASLPCIMITAESNERILHTALSLRVYSVLPKPISRDLITVVVRRAIGLGTPRQS